MGVWLGDGTCGGALLLQWLTRVEPSCFVLLGLAVASAWCVFHRPLRGFSVCSALLFVEHPSGDARTCTGTMLPMRRMS